MTTVEAVQRNASRLALAVTVIVGLTHLTHASVTRNRNGSYTAKYSVTCTGGNATDSDTGNTPRVSFTAPGGIGCNAGTRAFAERQVGTGKITERVRAVGGDRASAGDFSLPVVGLLPDASASLDMLERNVTSTEANFLISWSGDLGTGGEVQWFDIVTGDQLGTPIMFSGGTRQSLTVPITDLGGVNNIGFNAEIDAASINGPAPEPGGLALLGSGLVGIASLIRRRSST